MKRLKKLYQGLALLALIHVVVILAGVGMLASSGKLNKDSLRTVAEVLGIVEPEVIDEAGDTEALVEAGDESKPGTPTARSTDANSVSEELARRSLERAVTQAEHRRVLANRAMLDVRRRREELERLTKQRETKAQVQNEQKEKEGFSKDLEILSSLKPKVALDSLLARSVDEAAQMMLLLETRQAKKIMEAARKDETKWAKMLAIEERLRNSSTTMAQASSEPDVGGGASQAPAPPGISN